MNKINEAIEKILEWQKENNIIVNRIYIYAEMGGWYLTLTLARDGIKICHEFYLDGIPTAQSWKDYNEKELMVFLEEAKVKLKGEKNDSKRID